VERVETDTRGSLAEAVAVSSLSERASWAALAVCGCAALALRFYAIDRLPGINGDEPQYAVHAQSWFQGAALSSLRTGSDLPMNPVFFGMVALLQKLLPTSLWSLRLSAALLSVITIGLAWSLYRARGPLFAASFALLVAVLPIHLGYARFAWDPTAIPCVSVLALAASVQLRPVLCLLAFVLCLWVHPTTVFLAPILLAPFAASVWRRWPRRRLLIASLSIPSAIALLILALRRDMLPGAVSDVLRGDLLDNVWARARDLPQLGRFLLAYVELLSGPTIYRYITGSLSTRATHLHLWLSAALLLPLLAAGLRALAKRRWLDLSVAIGLFVSLLCEYLLAGPVALAAKTERYAVCLTVPGCYVISACVTALSTSPQRARALRAAVSCVGLALLLSFSHYYLSRLHRPDAAREDTFRTGATEPKARALQVIEALRDPARTAVVYVEDWWIYWTLRYLAPPSSGMSVTIYKHRWDYRFPQDFKPPPPDLERMQFFGVAWAGRAVDQAFAARSSQQIEIFGYEPGPILRVHQLPVPPRSRVEKRR
jgi:hypothetical protein